MPTSTAAFDALRASFEVLNEKIPTSQASINPTDHRTDHQDGLLKDLDISFLKNLIESPLVRNLLEVQEKLEDQQASAASPLRDEHGQLCTVSQAFYQVRELCNVVMSRGGLNQAARDARTLSAILENPHFEALVGAHDKIINKNYDNHSSTNNHRGGLDESYEMTALMDNSDDQMSSIVPTNAIRMVGVRKNNNEPLGMTVCVEDNGHVAIARILSGGLIDKQGLLHVGDVILEVDGEPVDSPETLMEMLKQSDEIVTFKISPSTKDIVPTTASFMRALFSYDPSADKLLPCKEVGLAFKQGDVLEVLNQEDPNWWQARLVSSIATRAGLIPSQELEERRRAFVRPEFDYATKTSICGTRIRKKKKKEMYQLRGNFEFDKAELTLYEEVCRTPPFERKTLILIGSHGVGKGALKSRLASYDPERFEVPLPYTSRPIRPGEFDGKNYYYLSREQMEKEIAEGKFLEWGEYQDQLYGTKLDTIREVIQSGKMCIIDCNPQVRQPLVFCAIPN